jgi:hypothetical protein
MTDAERRHLRTAVSRGLERGEIREALAASAATETIGRKLGDELITANREHNAASREVIAAWRECRNSQEHMAKAIENLERVIEKNELLVGPP